MIDGGVGGAFGWFVVDFKKVFDDPGRLSSHSLKNYITSKILSLVVVHPS